MKKWSIKLMSMLAVLMLVVGCGTTNDTPPTDNENIDDGTNLNRDNDVEERFDDKDEISDEVDEFENDLEDNFEDDRINRDDLTDEERNE